MATCRPGSLSIPGTAARHRGLDIAPREFGDRFEETHVPRSTALYAHINGRGSYLVGSMARYHASLQQLQKDTRHRRREVEKQRAELERRISRLVDAIAEGTVGDVGAVGEKLRELERRLATLPVLPDQESAPIEWHPKAVEIYKRSISDLADVLNANETARDDAVAALRTLVDRIVAYPGERRGQFDLSCMDSSPRLSIWETMITVAEG